MRTPSCTNQKIWPMLKFLQTNKQTGQKLYAPNLLMRGLPPPPPPPKKKKKKKKKKPPSCICETLMPPENGHLLEGVTLEFDLDLGK